MITDNVYNEYLLFTCDLNDTYASLIWLKRNAPRATLNEITKATYACYQFKKEVKNYGLDVAIKDLLKDLSSEYTQNLIRSYKKEPH